MGLDRSIPFESGRSCRILVECHREEITLQRDLKNTREFRTKVELFLAGVARWDSEAIRLVQAA